MQPDTNVRIQPYAGGDPVRTTKQAAREFLDRVLPATKHFTLDWRIREYREQVRRDNEWVKSVGASQWYDPALEEQGYMQTDVIQ